MPLLFAQFHPERTGRLLLVSPAAYPEGGTTPQWFWRVPGLAESVLMELPPQWIARSMLLFLYGDPRRVTAADVRAYAEFAASSEPMRGLILQERQLYPEPAVMARWVEGHRAVAAPARILWGTKDRVLPIEHAHRLAVDLPAAELRLLDGVGHVAQLEVPDVVLAEAVAFLRRP